jgi:hypothetical protein
VRNRLSAADRAEVNVCKQVDARGMNSGTQGGESSRSSAGAEDEKFDGISQ